MTRWMLPIALVAAGCGRLAFEPRGDSNSNTADTSPDGPSGAWSYLRNAGHTSFSGGQPSPHSIQVQVAAGDLVVVAADGNSPGGGSQIVFSTDAPGVLTFGAGFERDIVLIDHNGSSAPTTNAAAWGVVSAAAQPTTITITATNMTGWIDLSATVFHGGIAAPQTLAIEHTTGGAGGLVSCGPVPTVPGGLAFYIAVRWTCADAPIAGPFAQLGTLAGNPYGATAPNDGTEVSATLADCGNAGGWLCSTLSLTP